MSGLTATLLRWACLGGAALLIWLWWRPDLRRRLHRQIGRLAALLVAMSCLALLVHYWPGP